MRCIIIDDDPVSRRILHEYINQTDVLVSVGEFESPIEALNFLKREGGVDLVFLDVMLPNMDGFEFLNTLDETPQVIMISASENYAVRAFDFGATDYLLKPITYSRFFRGVSKAMKWMHPTGDEGELFLKKKLLAHTCPLQFYPLDRVYGELRKNYYRQREIYSPLYP
ncbi:MAG: LytR/AlgR family response regulator transcription factor [Bacteroides sp.]